MENTVVESSRNFDLQVFVTTSTADTTVRVSTPAMANDQGNRLYDQSRPVGVRTVEQFFLPFSLRLTANIKETKAILISANNDIVSYGVNMEEYSNDGFLAIPTSSLGTEYYAVCYAPSHIACQIGLAGVTDGTQVTVTFPAATGVSVTYDGQTYGPGDSLVLPMNRYDTLLLKTENNADLTGARVRSTNPIAVFSGNVRTFTENQPSRDHLVEQIPPTSTWGKLFYAMPIPNRQVGDLFRIVAASDGTTVNVTDPVNAPITRTLNAGEFAEIDKEPGQPIKVVADKGILLTQIAKSQSGNDKGDPSLIVIPPVEQYAPEYTFLTPTYSGATPGENYNHYLMLVVERDDKAGLRLDGSPLSSSLTWTPFADSKYEGTYISATSGNSYNIRHTAGRTFQGILYGTADRETFGFAIGQRLATIVSRVVHKNSPQTIFSIFNYQKSK